MSASVHYPHEHSTGSPGHLAANNIYKTDPLLFNHVTLRWFGIFDIWYSFGGFLMFVFDGASWIGGKFKWRWVRCVTGLLQRGGWHSKQQTGDNSNVLGCVTKIRIRSSTAVAPSWGNSKNHRKCITFQLYISCHQSGKLNTRSVLDRKSVV